MSEPKFLTKLLRANSATQQLLLSAVGPGDFVNYEAEARFIWEHHARFGKVPEEALVVEKFPAFIPEGTTEGPKYLIHSIKEEVLRRAIENELGEIYERVRTMENPFELRNLISGCADRLRDFGVGAEGVVSRWGEIGDRKRSLAEKLGRGVGKRSYSLPIKELDEAIGPLTQPNVVTLFARTGAGKTWFSTFIGNDAANKGLRTLLVSREMGTEELRQRVDALRFKMDWEKLRRGNLTLKERMVYLEACSTEAAKNLPLFFAGSEMDYDTIENIASTVVELKIDLVILDGAYQIDADGKNKVEKNYNRSEGFKRMCSRCQVIGLQTIQQSVSNEGTGESGGLASTSWGDAYNQDSDIVIEMWLPNGRDKPERVLTMHKSRNSRLAQAQLLFLFDRMRIVSSSSSDSDADSLYVDILEG